MRPADVFRRNFWFCTLNDPSAMSQRHRIGLDKITYEVDYPHADTGWPDSQQRLHRLIGEAAEGGGRHDRLAQPRT